jgi:CubicO group peptidase (beta-lactamase class C family)
LTEKYATAAGLIHEAIGRGFFPSACLEIGNKTGRIFRHWEGNRSVYPVVEPVEEDTLFDMASVTKILSPTMVALRFVEEGLLCLSDYVGDFFDAPEDKKEITIFNLLTHTSGIAPYVSIVDKAPSPEKAVETILNLELAFPVGQDVGYSCLGFIVLGKILELVGGATLDILSRKYVFEPLEMKNTTFRPEGDNIAATDFNRQKGTSSVGVVNDHNSRFLGGIAGNAGVFSNLDDLSNFAMMLANMGSYKGRQYLSSRTFAKAIRNWTPHFDQARGLGFLLTDTRINPPGELFSTGSYGHTGYTGTSVLVDKDTGLYVIFLTNRVHSEKIDDRILRFRRVLHNAILAASSPHKRENGKAG